ncbi:WRKY transcription factor 42-like [Phragmites australis]|uniref:WRKY transcription factor 42-like n=1 Tax=Phragmites australis TaxID=29695 RepID=UPI002D79C025|nr:WRKY transcription factor 42-like [Phragmites australis]
MLMARRPSAQPELPTPSAGPEVPAVVLGYDDGGGTAGAEERRVVDEMDFFKTEKMEKKEAAASGPVDLSIKEDDLTINMGLHVGRRKSGSEESIVDDGVHSNEGDHRETKAELVLAKSELVRLNEENKRLKSKLSAT